MKTWKICKRCSERFECENKKPCLALKKALQRVDLIRPAIIWADEIEKAFPQKKGKDIKKERKGLIEKAFPQKIGKGRKKK